MGTLISGDVLVSTSIGISEGSSPSVLALNDGSWVVSWSSSLAGSVAAYAVYGPGGANTVSATSTAYSGISSQFIDMALLSDGRFVMSFQFSDNSGNSYIRHQVFGSDGSLSELMFDTSLNQYSYTSNSLDIAPLSNGSWVEVYTDRSNAGVSYGQIHSQVDTNTSTTDVTLPSATGSNASSNYTPSVAGLMNGGFVAVWHKFDDGVFDYSGVAMRIFANDGTPAGNQVSVLDNPFPYNFSDTGNPEVTALPDGGFVVTFQVLSLGSKEIFHAVYDEDGSERQGATRVNVDATLDQSQPFTTALEGGGYAIAWTSPSEANGNGEGIYLRVFNSSGAAVSGATDIHVNTTETFVQNKPQIVALSGGGFVVAWQSTDSGIGETDFYYQRFAADGSKVGNEERINDPVSGSHGALTGLSLAAVDNDGFVAVWQSPNMSGSGTDIYQKYILNQNDAPSGTDGTATVGELGTYTFSAADFGFTDTNGDALKAVKITTLTTVGKLYLDGVAVTKGAIIDAADLGDLTYRPAVGGKTGNDAAKFTFQVQDDGGTASGGQDADETANTFVFDITPAPNPIKGSNGNDKLNGTAKIDWLQGLDGNDTLDGKAGGDRMEGGDDNDTYIVDNLQDDVIEQKNRGLDTVLAAVSFTLGDNVENLVLTGSKGNSGTGNSLANTLTGNNGANTLNGRGGADTLIGKGGDDIYYVDNKGDDIKENAGQGTDSVFAALSWSLDAGLENLTLTGSGNFSATGNAANNKIIGNSGNNVIDGGLGNDTMEGGGGNDTYTLDNASDSVTETLNAGNDTIRAGFTITLGDHIENLVLTGTANIDGTGNSADNRLTGNNGKNTLDGKAGNDLMLGLDGNDTYIVDAAGDTVSEDAGKGTDTVKASVSYTLTANVENLILEPVMAVGLTGTGNDLANSITGTIYNDTLIGGKGNDTLRGGTGEDRIEGGEGRDTLQGDNIVLDGNGNNIAILGEDIFVFDTALPTAAADADYIVDFTSLQDKIELSLSIFGDAGAVGSLSGSAFINLSLGNPWNSSIRIAYDPATGFVRYYAADATDGSDFTVFARLDKADVTQLSNFDFVIVS